MVFSYSSSNGLRHLTFVLDWFRRRDTVVRNAAPHPPQGTAAGVLKPGSHPEVRRALTFSHLPPYPHWLKSVLVTALVQQTPWHKHV